MAIVHRTARIRLRLTRRQADRCYGLLRAGGDVWAWILDSNRERADQGRPLVTEYQELCRELTIHGSVGELSVTGARSVVQRYADACYEAAKRRSNGQRAGFPRRKRALIPVRFCNARFRVDGRRVRLEAAKGCPELWVRLACPIPYPLETLRAVTLLHDAGRLWLAVTAALPVEHHETDPARVAGVDLGIVHPYAVVSGHAGLLVSGRAIRAEGYLHLRDQKARRARMARRAPKPGQHGSRRWRRYRAQERRIEARHRRRIHQAHHEAAGQVISFALRQRVGTLVVGDPKGITANEFGRVQNLRLRRWRRTHLMQMLCDKAARMGIIVRRVDERGTSSTCPACRRRTPKPQGRRFRCTHCMLEGHRDLVGAQNIAAVAGGPTRASLPVLVEHRRAGRAPARRDRRRHLLDRRRRGSCLASGLPAEPDGPSGRRSPVAERYPATGEDQAAPANEANVA
jgi:IS605 OrfB family transposase